MRPLPVLISIPHGGEVEPEEVRGRVGLSAPDLLADSDAFTGRIYDVGEEAAVVLRARVARAFVDLNREEADRPPDNPDGVVKAATCHGVPVYRPGREPDDVLIETLLQRYYRPYHQDIADAVSGGPRIQLGLDCHSMEPVGPAIAPDSGKPRPLFCLGNRRGLTCPDDRLRRMADCLRDSFGLEPDGVSLNAPFAGGHITRTYGNRPIPWMQIEMNRKLYLADPWFNPDNLTVDPERLRWLNVRFLRALQQFFNP